MEGPGVSPEVMALQQQVAELQHIIQQLVQQQANVDASRSKLKLPKPPETNGRQPSPVNWSHKMETYLTAEGANLHDPSIVAIAAAYLKDSALNWYRQHEQSVDAGKAQPYASWEEFKKAFIARFTPVDPEVDARERLDRLTQTRSVFAYAQTFNTYMLELPHMDENDRIHRFIRGLKPEVRIHVKLQQPTTLHDAVELAIKADSMVWERGRNGNNRFINTNYGNRGGAKAGPTPMELGAVEQQKPKTQWPLKCFYCGKPGHKKRDCKKLLADKQRDGNASARSN